MKEMKELIERLRRVAGSEEGQWDPVYNNAADALEAQAKQIEELQRELGNERARLIHTCHDDCTRDGCVNRRLRKQIEELAAALAEKDEALRAMLTHMGMDEDDWNKPTFNQARKSLALQPHASLVAKIKADAVLEFARGYADHREYFGETIKDDAQEYADRIEREGK